MFLICAFLLKGSYFLRYSNKLSGDDADRETPVHIPNTEANLVGPMVVRKGESACGGLRFAPIRYRLFDCAQGRQEL
jgi:hypothetical protein